MIFFRKNWVWFGIALVVLAFFSQTFLITWKTASPYCRADDWRFIDLYLRPLYNGQLRYSDLWSDTVHPLPVYAALFIVNAKYFSLQIHYIARIAIFFQLFLGILISYSFYKSLNASKTNWFLPIIALISLNSIIFSFIVPTPYTWPIVASLYLGSLLVLAIGYFSDQYYQQKKNTDYKYLVMIGLMLIISSLLYSDWTIIFCFSLLLLLFLIFLIEKTHRKKIVQLGSTLIIFLLIGLFLLRFFFKEVPREFETTNIFTLIINNPILTIKSLSVGLSSGILNFKWVTKTFASGEELYVVLSIIFSISYIMVFASYIYKKLYRKSILAPAMMIYSIVYVFSVFIFRYNPVDNGVFCLTWPRYAPYYQIGIIGYLWGLFLILDALAKKRPKLKNSLLAITCSISLLLIISWGNDSRLTNKTAEILRKKYPEVSQNIRDKLYNNEIEIPWSNHPSRKRDISLQLKFLHDHELNIFAPNYPYPESVKKSDDLKSND